MEAVGVANLGSGVVAQQGPQPFTVTLARTAGTIAHSGPVFVNVSWSGYARTLLSWANAFPTHEVM
jgi:hypothetical protein